MPWWMSRATASSHPTGRAGRRPDRGRHDWRAAELADETAEVDQVLRDPHPRPEDKDVAAAPSFGDIQDEVRRALDADVLVAHNAHVDRGVLQHHLGEWECPEIFDTLKLAKRLVPPQTSYKLGALVEEFSFADGLSADLSPHRATYDVLVAARGHRRRINSHRRVHRHHLHRPWRSIGWASSIDCANATPRSTSTMNGSSARSHQEATNSAAISSSCLRCSRACRCPGDSLGTTDIRLIHTSPQAHSAEKVQAQRDLEP